MKGVTSGRHWVPSPKLLSRPKSARNYSRKKSKKSSAGARLAHERGLPGLEKEFSKVASKEDSFLQHCIKLVLAGYTDENLRGKLETFMNTTYERNMVRATILNTMANIAPGFGMIGTLVGLIVMLSELDGGTRRTG